jgi:thiamine-phosphate pyrophosphorylase
MTEKKTMLTQHLKLCLVTDPQNQSFTLYKKFILQAIAGGVTSVQLRIKTDDQMLVHDRAQELKALLDPLNIPLILNDHVEIALAVDAAGVHLGQSDLAPMLARSVLGANKIIGWSVETLAELELANQMDCIDYIGASAVFNTQSKQDCKTIWGLDGLQKITRASRHPVVAIGGINHTNIASVIKSGATGVAIVGAIHNRVTPFEAAKELITNGWEDVYV